jgi:hypothetical protein
VSVAPATPLASGSDGAGLDRREPREGSDRARPVPAAGWGAAVRSATVAAFGRAPVRILALLAFLARGGIVALVLPLLVLPSPIGVGVWVGPTSVTAAGPTLRFVALVMAVVAAAAIILVAAFVLAAAAEVALHQATAAPDPDEPDAGIAPVPPGGRGWSGTFRVATVRLALLVPVLFAVGLAAPSIAAAGYQELTLPSDVGTPLIVRIAGTVPLAIAVIGVTWLLGEIVGGLAARRIVLFGASAPAAVAAAVLHLVRRPGTAVLSLLATGIVSLLVLVPAVVAAVAAADRAQTLLAGDAGAPGVIGATLLVTAVFAGTIVLAAGAAAWRAALWTAEVLRAAGVRPPGS